MTPFWDNLQLVINKSLYHWCDSFPGIDYISNEQALIGISEWSSSQNHIGFFWIFNTKMILVIWINFYI